MAKEIVPRVRQVPQASGGRPAYIRQLTPLKAYSQILKVSHDRMLG